MCDMLKAIPQPKYVPEAGRYLTGNDLSLAAAAIILD
jgi:hypothetical protein